MKLMLCAVLAVMLAGCTVVGGITGAVTGIYDCTAVRVDRVGWAGIMWVPIAPFEGAYRGAQIGWYRDRKVWSGEPDALTIRASVQPCWAAAIMNTSVFSPPLTWNVR